MKPGPHPDATLDSQNDLGKCYELPEALQDIYAMSEAEARAELALLCDRTRLLFVFWKVKEVVMKQKYENKLYLLNQKVSSNSMLWEQLAEAEKRENILR